MFAVRGFMKKAKEKAFNEQEKKHAILEDDQSKLANKKVSTVSVIKSNLES